MEAHRGTSDDGGYHEMMSKLRSHHPTKNHPLFPILEYTAQAVHRHDLILKKLDTEIIAVKSTQEELKRLLDENNKKSFNLKDNDYEDRLRVGTATIYIGSLFRDVDDDHLEKLVRTVLKNETVAKEHKIKVAMKFVKQRLSVFRSEEKRRVLGLPPCAKYAQMSSTALCEAMIKFFKAASTEERKKKYKLHLILLRKFVREGEVSKDDHFFQSFKEWATKKYPGPPIGTPSDEEWKNLLELDSQYQYNGATASASGQEALDNELDDLLLDAM